MESDRHESGGHGSLITAIAILVMSINIIQTYFVKAYPPSYFVAEREANERRHAEVMEKIKQLSRE